MARPTIYSDDILTLAEDYRDNLPNDEVIHTVEGLADHIKIARSTIYKWSKEEGKEVFSDIVEAILNKQGKSLLNKGLTGEYNATIGKVLLTKHGYREGIEQSGVDGEPLLSAESKEKIREALNEIG